TSPGSDRGRQCGARCFRRSEAAGRGVERTWSSPPAVARLRSGRRELPECSAPESGRWGGRSAGARGESRSQRCECPSLRASSAPGRSRCGGRLRCGASAEDFPGSKPGSIRGRTIPFLCRPEAIVEKQLSALSFQLSVKPSTQGTQRRRVRGKNQGKTSNREGLNRGLALSLDFLVLAKAIAPAVEVLDFPRPFSAFPASRR